MKRNLKLIFGKYTEKLMKRIKEDNIKKYGTPNPDITDPEVYRIFCE